MNRRSILQTAGLSLLAAGLTKPARAWFPHGVPAGPPPTASIQIAAQPTSGETGSYVAITLAWAGSAPSGLTGVWNHSGGSATISGFTVVTGGWLTCFATTPSSANAAYQLTLTGTGSNTGSATTTSINVAAAVVDFSPGIYGPSTVTYGQNQPEGDDNGAIVIGTWFARGLAGPQTASLTGTDGAKFVITQGFSVGFDSPNAGWQVQVTFASYNQPQTTFAITVNITDGITTYSQNVTVLNPVGGAQPTGEPTIANSNNLVLDSATGAGGVVWVSGLQGSAYLTGYTFTPDSGNLFSSPSGSYQIQIAQSSLVSANFGSHTMTVTPQGASGPGTPMTVTIWIGHESPPVLKWQPNGVLSSATPATNNYGSNQIGTLLAGSDLAYLAYSLTSNPSGALNIYSWDYYYGRTGFSYLLNSVAAGTLTGTCQITSPSGLSTSMVLTLPVKAGVLYSSSEMPGTPVGGLTNFLTTAAQHNPTGSNTTVLNANCSAFTPDWSLSTVDVLNDNCQLAVGSVFFTMAYVPRYALVSGSGGSFTVTAWNLSATNPTTPQVDELQITLTDGNGNYCINTFNITTSWHPYTGAALTCGPGGTWATPDLMLAAFKASPSTYAGATVTLLQGVQGFPYWTASLDTQYAGGWYPCPIHLVGDSSTQATFTGSISNGSGGAGNILAVSSSTGLVVGQMVITGATNCILVSQTDSTHWVVNGAPQLVTSTTMTTQAMIVLEFAFYAPGGSYQGGLMAAGGYDVVFERMEISNVSNGSNAAGIWCSIGASGNVTMKNLYIHNCNNGFLGGDNGRRISILDCLFAACGTAEGAEHNIYIDGVAFATTTGTYSVDSLGHAHKCRALGFAISNNFFLEGLNCVTFDSTIDFPAGGIGTFTDNVIMKGTNDAASNNGHLIDWASEINEGNKPAWANSTITASGNTIINTMTPGGAPEAPVAWCNVFYSYDPIRGPQFPIVMDLTDNEYYNLPHAQWYGGAAPPTGGAGEATVTNFPFTGISLTYPLIGGPPLNLPYRALPNAGGAEIGSAPGTYAMIMTVPTGSGPGTSVTGGYLAGYDSSGSGTVMTGISASATGNFGMTVNTSAAFTGAISGTALTTSGVTGTISPSRTLQGASVPSGNAQAIIASGSGSSWTVGVNQYLAASASMTSSAGATFTGSIINNALTVNPGSVSGPALAASQTISGPAVPAGTTITGGSGANWTIEVVLSIGSESMTSGADAAQMTITNSPADGLYYTNLTFTGSGVSPFPGVSPFSVIVGTGAVAPS
jgi:hypothetical protein